MHRIRLEDTSAQKILRAKRSVRPEGRTGARSPHPAFERSEKKAEPQKAHESFTSHHPIKKLQRWLPN